MPVDFFLAVAGVLAVTSEPKRFQPRGIMSGPCLKKQPNSERPCLACSKKHRNNQAYCSAQCCEEYRKRHTGGNSNS